MPTKRNRAGQQQNYVPQGNGDASGEYADQASGSNKHFANFKKPEEKPAEAIEETKATEVVEQPKEDTSKYLGGSKAKSDFSATVFSKGMSKYGEDFEKDFKEIIANANEQSIGILNHSIKNYGIFFIRDEKNSSYFKPETKEISIKPSELIRDYDEAGETVFHELGHYINEVNKTKEPNKWWQDDNRLTETHQFFEDNMSVAETLQEEIKEFAANKHATRIRAERKKFLNQRLKPYGFTAEQFERDSDKTKDILRNEAFNNTALKMRCYGKAFWFVYKLFEKTVGRLLKGTK